MEFMVHLLLAFALAVIVAPHADRLREMWRNSLFSSEFTIFLAPRPARKRGEKRRANLCGCSRPRRTTRRSARVPGRDSTPNLYL